MDTAGRVPESESASKEKREEDEDVDDEDYNPNEEDAQDDDDDAMDVVEDVLSAKHLTSLQLKQVDQAFEELFGYKWGTSFTLPRNRSEWTPQQLLLCQVLGQTAAATILQSHATTGGKRKNRLHRKQQPYKIKLSTRDGTDVRAQVPSARADGVSRKLPEKFKQQSVGGVDKLLKQLAAPEKVSTVAKTSADWDQFKEKTGLGEKLEEQADSKDAYLKRQDFLTRVDHRRFELEKEERDKNRVKRK